MANLMDRSGFDGSRKPAPDFQSALNQAMQNPQAFSQMMQQNNPQAYQQAMQIAQSGNPKAAILQMAKAKGINPMLLKKFGF